MLGLMLVAALAGADAGAAPSGEPVPLLSVVLAPGAAPGAVKMVLTPSWGEPRTLEVPAGGEDALQRELGAALDAGPAQQLVLSVDTRLTRAQAVPALSAARERGLQPELRFAGPTNLPGGKMPPVLELLKEVGVAPPLSKADVEAVHRAVLPTVRACYEAELRANTLEGRLVVQLTVGADGEVASAVLQQNELSDAAVAHCVLGALAQVRFPKLRGAPRQLVTWPFVFRKGAPQPPNRP